MACEVALEAAHGLHPCVALGFLALQVGAGLRVQAFAGDRDDMQSPIDLAVAPAVQAMAVVSARADGTGAMPASLAKWASLLKCSALGQAFLRAVATLLLGHAAGLGGG